MEKLMFWRLAVKEYLTILKSIIEALVVHYIEWYEY